MTNESSKAHFADGQQSALSVIQKSYAPPAKAEDLTHRLEDGRADIRSAAMKEFIDMPIGEQLKLSKQIMNTNQTDLAKDFSLPEISIDFDIDYFTHKPVLIDFRLDYEPGTKNQELQTGVQTQLIWDKGV